MVSQDPQQADPVSCAGAGKHLQSGELGEDARLGSVGPQGPLKDSTKRCVFADVLGQWEPKSEALGTGFPNAE